MTFEVKSITAIVGSTEPFDQLLFVTDKLVPDHLVKGKEFPLILTLNAKKGTGIQFCKEQLNMEPDILDTDKEWEKCVAEWESVRGKE